MKKKKSLKRELIEWGVFLGIIATLFITGLHTDVIGFLQRGVLKTGLIKPSMETDMENLPDASYNLKLVNEQEEVLDFENLRGKTVFINFWATWCPPCIAEMPEIQSLYEDVQDQEDIVFALISLDEEKEKAWQFVEKKGYTFPVYRLATNLPQVYSSQSIPTTFVISPSGKIAAEHRGMASYDNDKFREFLLSL